MFINRVVVYGCGDGDGSGCCCPLLVMGASGVLVMGVVWQVESPARRTVSVVPFFCE